MRVLFIIIYSTADIKTMTDDASVSSGDDTSPLFIVRILFFTIWKYHEGKHVLYKHIPQDLLINKLIVCRFYS